MRGKGLQRSLIPFEGILRSLAQEHGTANKPVHELAISIMNGLKQET